MRYFAGLLLAVRAYLCWAGAVAVGEGSEDVKVTGVGDRITGGQIGAFQPYASLEAALDGPRSEFLGITPQRRPRDSKTRYTAGGVSGAEEPPTFHLSFEVTNNQILCSLTSTGLLKNPCIFSRRVAAHRRGRQFMGEQLLGGSPWSFLLRRTGEEPVSLHSTHGVSVELLGDLFPLFTYQCEGLRTRLLALAPETGGPSSVRPRAILVIAQVENPGAEAIQATLIVPGIREAGDADRSSALSAPVESPHPRFTENPVPIQPGYEAVMCLDHNAWSPTFPELSFSLPPGGQGIFAFAFLLGETPEELRRTGELLRTRSTLDWLNQTWRSRAERYGRLRIPDDPYYAESYSRLIEEGASALMYTDNGLLWTGGPSGFSDFAMVLFEPRFIADIIAQSLSGFRPRKPGEPPSEDLSYSLAGAVGALPDAALYYRMTGDKEFFRAHPEILAFARERLTDLLSVREGEPYLFPSKMLWDGPSRGDYHTGSNVLAWLSFEGIAEIARSAYEDPKLADEWSAVAARIHADIDRYCAGEGSLGRRYYEGANSDGTFVLGHDGEEAFTTLMPFFGYCQADDPAYVNHARLALTRENPLYIPEVDGIGWSDGRDAQTMRAAPPRGATTLPGQMAMFAGAVNEGELHDRLEQLRGFTDLDGSLWWWPYDYPALDATHVRRRDVAGCDLSKGGYVAAIYVCLFVNNILGLHVDVPAHQVSLRPFCPWPEFSWERCRLGNSIFDFGYENRDGCAQGLIVNRNDGAFDAAIELTLPEGAQVREVTMSGTATDKATRTRRFGRPAVRLSEHLPSGEALRLEVTYSTAGGD
ncbi:MAG: hypothetical protein ACE149_08905 [Armatimonadota bacterium]